MFKKTTKRSTNIRKRPLNDEPEDDYVDEITVIVPEKQRKIDQMKHDNELDDDDTNANKLNLYSASGKTQSLLPADMGATAVQEIDTDKSADATAILERTIQLQKELEGKEDDKVYRGQAGYAQYYKKRDTAAGNATSSKIRIGPVRASSNIRVTARFDYAPDICKDYKETGFCGYGDSCIFLHDRGDYKAGWEIDREWEIETKKKREMELRGETGDDDVDEEADELPSICPICDNIFTNPVITKCRHYFCEECAIREFQLSPKCFSCGENTKGIFNVAKDLINKK